MSSTVVRKRPFVEIERQHRDGRMYLRAKRVEISVNYVTYATALPCCLPDDTFKLLLLASIVITQAGGEGGFPPRDSLALSDPSY